MPYCNAGHLREHEAVSERKRRAIITARNDRTLNQESPPSVCNSSFASFSKRKKRIPAKQAPTPNQFKPNQIAPSRSAWNAHLSTAPRRCRSKE